MYGSFVCSPSECIKTFKSCVSEGLLPWLRRDGCMCDLLMCTSWLYTSLDLLYTE